VSSQRNGLPQCGGASKSVQALQHGASSTQHGDSTAGACAVLVKCGGFASADEPRVECVANQLSNSVCYYHDGQPLTVTLYK
jgi:phosphoribosylformylglycinamidine (FGAM) synthase-like amidotransferase family enzyme